MKRSSVDHGRDNQFRGSHLIGPIVITTMVTRFTTMATAGSVSIARRNGLTPEGETRRCRIHNQAERHQQAGVHSEVRPIWRRASPCLIPPMRLRPEASP